MQKNSSKNTSPKNRKKTENISLYFEVNGHVLLFTPNQNPFNFVVSQKFSSKSDKFV